jgi:hypothetical protein
LVADFLDRGASRHFQPRVLRIKHLSCIAQRPIRAAQQQRFRTRAKTVRESRFSRDCGGWPHHAGGDYIMPRVARTLDGDSIRAVAHAFAAVPPQEQHRTDPASIFIASKGEP